MTKDQLITLIKGELSGISPDNLTKAESNILRHIKNYETEPCLVHSFKCPSLSAAPQCSTNKRKFKISFQVIGEDTNRSWLFDNKSKAFNMFSWLKASTRHYNVDMVEF